MADYLRARRVADKQIRKWGARALLRRTGADDRECWAMEAELSANERRDLKSPTNHVYLISAVDLDLGPVYAKDSLVTFEQPDGVVENPPFRQVAPTRPLSPGGIVIYWEIEVQG